MILVPIPGTPLEPESQPDKVGLCLQHWVCTARGMHTETWTEWAQETREALNEYNSKTRTAENKDTVFSL